RIAANLTAATWVAVTAHLLILISLGIYVRYIWDVPKHTRSRIPVPGGAVSVAYYLNFAVFIVVFIWTAALFVFPDRLNTFPISETVVFFLIIGWFAASILSYLSKIVPFLWWGYQFQTKWEKKSKIMLTEMTRDKWMNALLYSYLAGIVFVCLAFLLYLP